jgi:pyruvate formate lyase activating enzyme
MDPVEKKPLFHFHPGKLLLSVGSLGCNLDCSFCQNHHISHGESDYYQLTSQELMRLAEKSIAKEPDCVGIAFTYNEPVIGYEWVKDVAALSREKGGVNVLVTNGFLSPAPWRELIACLDAINIDVKSFSEQFYHEQCGGSLAPVLRNVEAALPEIHVELTYLVVPSLNDDPKEVTHFADWVADLSPDIPVHFTRYFPSHRLHLAPTPLAALKELVAIASNKLNFVYLGNVGEAADTVCPVCGQLLIERKAFSVRTTGLIGGHCSGCGRRIPGVGL